MPVSGLSGNDERARHRRSDALRGRQDGASGQVEGRSVDRLPHLRPLQQSLPLRDAQFFRVCGPLGASVSGSGPRRPLAHPGRITENATVTANVRRFNMHSHYEELLQTTHQPPCAL